MKLPRILTLVLFTFALLACGLGIYLKVNGTVTWGQFAGWEVSTLALAAIIGRMVLYDAQKK
jgi:hypothetical protein